jgi:hypothetical protein
MCELISMDIQARNALMGDIIGDMVVLKIRIKDGLTYLENQHKSIFFGDDTVISIYRWSH